MKDFSAVYLVDAVFSSAILSLFICFSPFLYFFLLMQVDAFRNLSFRCTWERCIRQLRCVCVALHVNLFMFLKGEMSFRALGAAFVGMTQL